LFFFLSCQIVLIGKPADTAYVKGKLIDIINVQTDGLVFPQNKTFKFKYPLPGSVKQKMAATSLIENEGVSQVKFSAKCDIYIGYSTDNLNAEGWVYTKKEFDISSARKYFIYKRKYEEVGQWIDIPRKPKAKSAPTLLFADQIRWVNPKEVPGVVITKVEKLRETHLTNPTITILPDGDYLAAISGAFHKTGAKRATSFFLSTNKGKTWSPQSKNSLEINYANLFVHNGELYIMGTRAPQKEVIISKSADKGKTWTQPKNKDNGIVLSGKYHSAPVPVVVHNGRIWRAMETNKGNKQPKEAFVISAPEDSDLLKASNWTASGKLPYDKDWISGNGRSFKQWIEGNVVVDRNNNIVNVLRVDEQKMGGVAAVITVSGTEKLMFDPDKDIIEFPGGGKKFTIRYDSVSDKYWALSNPVFEEDRGMSHSGIYKNGIHCGLIRNHLVLMYSDDLRNWTVKDTLITSNDPFFHGFQYVDWQFDGNDIIAVSRTAFEEERGLPTRQHDANFFLFHRFKNFRKEKIETIKIEDNL